MSLCTAIDKSRQNNVMPQSTVMVTNSLTDFCSPQSFCNTFNLAFNAFKSQVASVGKLFSYTLNKFSRMFYF